MLAAMAAHTVYADMHGQSCRVLVNLAKNDNNKTAIATAGGIPSVLAVIVAHTRHTDVQVYSCCALANLANEKNDNQTVITAGEGIPMLLAAMTAHKWEWTCRSSEISQNQAEKSRHQQRQSNSNCSRAGGVPVVMAGMMAHTGHTGAQEHGC